MGQRPAPARWERFLRFYSFTFLPFTRAFLPLPAVAPPEEVLRVTALPLGRHITAMAGHVVDKAGKEGVVAQGGLVAH